MRVQRHGTEEAVAVACLHSSFYGLSSHSKRIDLILHATGQPSLIPVKALVTQADNMIWEKNSWETVKRWSHLPIM